MKLRTILSKAVLPALLTITAGTANAATVADLAADYVTTNGLTYTTVSVPANYAYLRSTAASGGTETPLTANAAVGNHGNSGFGGGGFLNIPAVMGNVVGTAADYFLFDNYKGAVVGTDLIVHPSGTAPFLDSDPFVLVRYTLTAADLLNGTTGNISGNFNSQASGAVDVSVYQNGTPLFSLSTPGPGVNPYNVNFTAAVGDQITFAVGSAGNFGGDETSLNGIITLVPEPATASLGLIGALSLLRRRRA